MDKDKIIDLTSKIHAGNILGFLEEIIGRLSDDDFVKAEESIQSYIKRYFSDAGNVRGKE